MDSSRFGSTKIVGSGSSARLVDVATKAATGSFNPLGFGMSGTFGRSYLIHSAASYQKRYLPTSASGLTEALEGVTRS
jgi:hypothetical protein